MEDRLVQLWQEMSELTAPLCAGKSPGGCKCPHSCCDPLYCEMALEYAKDIDNVALPTTEHPTLPLMGPDGCTCPPQYRPLCTLHVCCISSLGFNPADEAWTARYFKLRAQLESEGGF